MYDAVAIVLTVTGAIALVVAIRGSLRRDAAWTARFRAAATDGERQRLMSDRPRNSPVWRASHVTLRWGLAIYGAAALAIALGYWAQH